VSELDLDRALREVFGFDELRPGQREVMEDVLAGHPTVTVMPTGAGKSLCYQLPAVVLGEAGGVTLVVSPLIALMKDQVDSLVDRGIAATALTSAATAAEQADILAGIRGGVFTLVYVAPERFRSPRFLQALREVGDKLALLAIDEAHCISEWGHEFRPDYRRLGEAYATLRPPRLVALTATATPEVRDDIARQLDVETPRLHVHGFDRPNLTYSVEQAGGARGKAKRIVELVRGRNGGVALVYAATRKNAEKYAAALGEAGLRARVYHAGLGDQDRRNAQDEFMNDDCDVIVATNAFGMGVDKSDIRVVVHADVPRSPEAYYQESGRGGRDGAPTDCVLLFNHSDVRLQEFLIDASFPSADVLRGMWKLLREDPGLGTDRERLAARLPGEPHDSVVSSAARILARHGFAIDDYHGLRATKPAELGGEYPAMDLDAHERREQVERQKMRKMVEYSYHPRCRRQYMLEYFGDDDWDDRTVSCGGCDNCLGRGHTQPLDEDQHDHVRGLLSVVAALDGRFGRTKIAGVANAKDDDPRLEHLEERGCLAGQSSKYLMDLLRSLEGAGLIEAARGEYPTLTMTRAGDAVLTGGVAVADAGIAAPAKKKSSRARLEAAAIDSDLDPEIVGRLRAMRTRLASEKGVPAYVVMSNKTLAALAEHCPGSLEQLANVHGIGPSKIQKYGDDILAAIRG